MQENEVFFSQTIYLEQLSTINGVNFTRREIDVISCLLNARRTNQIASILSIAPRTVTTHFRNIMLRLGCNSQEGIINFIERSHTFSILRNHYSSLVVNAAFEKSLREVSRLKREEGTTCLIIYWQDPSLKSVLIHSLGNHLAQAGVSAEIRDQGWDHEVGNRTNQNQILLLFTEKKHQTEISQRFSKFDFLDLSEQQNYYFSIFEILKILLPNNDWDKILTNFKNQIQPTYYKSENVHIETTLNGSLQPGKNIFKKAILCFSKISLAFSTKRKVYFSLGMVFFLTIFVTYILTNNDYKSIIVIKNDNIKNMCAVRPNLILPNNNVFLNRPDLLAEIDEKLKRQEGIQTVALVGAGGAGKTMIARNYARAQPTQLIWELNSETSNSLIDSFEKMAERLARTEEEKKTLNKVQEIKDSQKREEKLLLFVQEKLRAISDWLLIYDNVDELATVQNYFPQDKEIWGEGKVILTTRNSNIHNNKRVNSIIQVGELNPTQKLTLFSKIMNQGSLHSFLPSKREEAKEFLEKVPPFPLDISVAAYYLRVTNTPYVTYLENINTHSKNFVNIQEDILREAGDYAKTRYGIITLSLQHIINTHKDFGDLLLFVSLLDPHNIPRDLLDRYKSHLVVDSFIHCLKKHSFITNESLTPSSNTTFSLHQSTLAISLDYLMNSLNLGKNRGLLHFISKIMESYTADAINNEEFTKMKLLINHYETFLSHDKFFNNSIGYDLEITLGTLYYYLCYFMKSENVLKKNLINLEKSNNKDYLKMARLSYHLGNTYARLGYYREPKDLLEHSLLIYRKYSPKSYVEIANTLSHLGDIYRSLGDYKKAINSLEQSMEIYKKYLPESQGNMGFAISCLGNVYRELGNYKKSMSLLEQGLNIYKNRPHENDIGFVWVIISLGMLHSDMGNYEEAKNMLEKSLITVERNSPEDHANMGWAVSCLGNVYVALGDYKKAEILLKKSLIIYETHLSNDYLNMAWVSGYLGNLYVKLENYDEAEKLLKKSLMVYEEHFGKNHVEPARVLRNLGAMYLLRGQLEIGEKLIKDALRIFEQYDHPEVYKCQENLAEFYIRKSVNSEEKKDVSQAKAFKIEAINHLHQALKIAKLHFSKDSPHIVRIETKLKKLK